MKRALQMVSILAALAVASGCSQPQGKTESMTVAFAPFESVGLVFVAQDQGLFEANNLNVTYRKYDTGVGALDAVTDGEADIAVGTAEYPLVGKAFERVPVSTIASIDRPDFIYVVGRKDRGIEKPSDVRGKRIGTVAGSIAQFYLGRFMELNDIRPEEITFVDLRTPDEWRAAIVNADVDAVVLAQPEASLVRDQLGSKAAFFSVQEEQPAYTLAIGEDEWISKNPDAVKKFLRALADAEKFVADHPDEAMEIIQERLELDSDYMSLVAGQNTFGLSLDQSLIIAMEDEARWMIRSRITSQTAIPDFSNHVHTDGLLEVKPDAVNMIR